MKKALTLIFLLLFVWLVLMVAGCERPLAERQHAGRVQYLRECAEGLHPTEESGCFSSIGNH